MVDRALHSGEPEPSRSERAATRTQQVGDHYGMVILHPLRFVGPRLRLSAGPLPGCTPSDRGRKAAGTTSNWTGSGIADGSTLPRSRGLGRLQVRSAQKRSASAPGVRRYLPPRRASPPSFPTPVTGFFWAPDDRALEAGLSVVRIGPRFIANLLFPQDVGGER